MADDALKSSLEMKQELERRMNEFTQAMARGGRRESYADWQASRTALAAAVEIIAVLEKRHD